MGLPGLQTHDEALLVCPDCRGPLRFEGDALTCAEGSRWPVRDGWVHLFRAEHIPGTERLLWHIYDHFSPLHDPAVRTTLPLVQGGGTEEELRGALMEAMAFRSVPPGGRILEVGIGTGANLPFLLPYLRPDIEVWGMDTSLGMLTLCRRRCAVEPALQRTRLFLGDAHHLPFPDHSFERVFHMGGIAAFRDPGLALREMMRVAKPGTPIAVVDEELDPGRPHRLWHRVCFRAVTFYDPKPHCPVEGVPPDAVDVEVTHPGRFFYLLRFRSGGSG